jgi:hypothetical protein
MATMRRERAVRSPGRPLARPPMALRNTAMVPTVINTIEFDISLEHCINMRTLELLLFSY